jgi:SAM-dependent methyltransferase
MTSCPRNAGDHACEKCTGYRASHTAPGHGKSYDAYYTDNPQVRLLWSLEQVLLKEILDRYFRDRQIHLLDFACGTGRITQFLEPYVTTSVGVDISAAMLEVARNKLTKTHLIHADLTTNNVLQGRRFNLITAFRFFLNAEPDLRKQVIRILPGLLSEDGYLLWNNHRQRAAPTILINYISNRSLANPLPHNVMSIHEMKNLAGEADLQIVEMRHVGVLLPRLVRVLPHSWSRTIETATMRLHWLRYFSEDVIAVCRRPVSHR